MKQQKLLESHGILKTKQAALLKEVEDLKDHPLTHNLEVALKKKSVSQEELHTIEYMIQYHKKLEEVKQWSTYQGLQYLMKQCDEFSHQLKVLKSWLMSHSKKLQMSEQEFQESYMELTRIRLLERAFKLYDLVHKEKIDDRVFQHFLQTIDSLLTNKLTKELQSSCK